MVKWFHIIVTKQQSESDSSMFEDWSSNELNCKFIRKLRIFGPNKRNLSKRRQERKIAGSTSLSFINIALK
jgi:hypothetical protein